MAEINLKTTELKTEPNIGKRILAGLIDYLIICTFSFIYIYTFGNPNEEGGYSVHGWPAFIPTLFWGIMTVGLETFLGGTLGNSLAGLKVIPINRIDQKLTFGASFKRHLLDPIDMFVFGLIGIITIKNTDKNQRLGDIWGNTIVIRNASLDEVQK